MKFTLEEFIFNILEELEQYEDLKPDDIEAWVKTFESMVEDNKISNKNLKKIDGEISFEVQDEMEIFAIVDDYIEAIENNSVKEYWKTFM